MQSNTTQHKTTNCSPKLKYISRTSQHSFITAEHSSLKLIYSIITAERNKTTKHTVLLTQPSTTCQKQHSITTQHEPTSCSLKLKHISRTSHHGLITAERNKTTHHSTTQTSTAWLNITASQYNTKQHILGL